MNCVRALLLLLSLTVTLTSPASGQEKIPDLFNLGQSGQGPDLGLPGQSANSVKIELVPKDARAGEEVTLRVTATMPPGSFTYSQNPDYVGKTQFRLNKMTGLESIESEFKPDREPKTAFDPVLKKELEKFYDRVTWSRKFRILPEAKQVTLQGVVEIGICDDQSCTRQDEEIDIDYAPVSAVAATESTEEVTHPLLFEARPDYQGDAGPASVAITLAPENAQPGETVTLTVTIGLDETWHTFSMTQPKGPGATATELNLLSYQGLEEVEPSFSPAEPFESKTIEIPGSDPIRQQLYHGEASWSRTFKVKPDATTYGVSGELVYQACTEVKCLQPKVVEFAVGTLSDPRDATHLNQLPSLNAERQFEIEDEFQGSLALVLLYAFLGGLILNIMPCVLPVLAIKILSFVKQAGESRARILELNIAYSVGVIGVFLCLATLAAFLKTGWGELFQSSAFNLVMACVVFAMGLSLLGVFEIPIPGLAGGGSQQEGLSGAFLTGIFATFLATPCSGPFMGVTLAWSVKQSTTVIYLVWGIMGLGMASPYLLCGFFPQLLKVLPKPGPWMVRFKEFSGFALMGALIWIISFMDMTATIPLLIMLMGIALGLWMIGNLYDMTTPIAHKTRVRVIALVLSAGIIGFGYTRLHPESDVKLDWVDFSEVQLEEHLTEGKTVLIDFTADWCAICKQNEALALNTSETKELVEEKQIVTMMADYTDRSPEIKKWIEKFQHNGVPLMVIIPGNNPSKPLVFRGPYRQATLLDALEEATNATNDPVETKTVLNETDTVPSL